MTLQPRIPNHQHAFLTPITQHPATVYDYSSKNPIAPGPNFRMMGDPLPVRGCHAHVPVGMPKARPLETMQKRNDKPVTKPAVERTGEKPAAAKPQAGGAD